MNAGVTMFEATVPDAVRYVNLIPSTTEVVPAVRTGRAGSTFTKTDTKYEKAALKFMVIIEALAVTDAMFDDTFAPVLLLNAFTKLTEVGVYPS